MGLLRPKHDVTRTYRYGDIDDGKIGKKFFEFLGNGKDACHRDETYRKWRGYLDAYVVKIWWRYSDSVATF